MVVSIASVLFPVGSIVCPSARSFDETLTIETDKTGRYHSEIKTKAGNDLVIRDRKQGPRKESSKHEVMGRKEWMQVCLLRSIKVEGTARRKRTATNGVSVAWMFQRGTKRGKSRRR